jgi:hypothetical protein
MHLIGHNISSNALMYHHANTNFFVNNTEMVKIGSVSNLPCCAQNSIIKALTLPVCIYVVLEKIRNVFSQQLK